MDLATLVGDTGRPCAGTWWGYVFYCLGSSEWLQISQISKQFNVNVKAQHQEAFVIWGTLVFVNSL